MTARTKLLLPKELALMRRQLETALDYLHELEDLASIRAAKGDREKRDYLSGGTLDRLIEANRRCESGASTGSSVSNSLRRSRALPRARLQRSKPANAPAPRRAELSGRGAGDRRRRPRARTEACRAPRGLTPYWKALLTWMMVGPSRTTKRTGRKNTTIGTVSFAGRLAAFSSASDMRVSRFSCATTRSETPIGVP